MHPACSRLPPALPRVPVSVWCCLFLLAPHLPRRLSKQHRAPLLVPVPRLTGDARSGVPIQPLAPARPVVGCTCYGCGPLPGPGAAGASNRQAHCHAGSLVPESILPYPTTPPCRPVPCRARLPARGSFWLCLDHIALCPPRLPARGPAYPRGTLPRPRVRVSSRRCGRGATPGPPHRLVTCPAGLPSTPTSYLPYPTAQPRPGRCLQQQPAPQRTPGSGATPNRQAHRHTRAPT